jgi:hypothetical protein
MTARTYSRRRFALRPAGVGAVCVVCSVVGFAIGIGGSMLKPGPWFAPADAFDLVQRPPAPGRLLEADDGAAVVLADSVRHLGPPAVAVAIVVVVRGRWTGRRPAWIDCTSGGVIQLEGVPSTTWRSSGDTLVDLVGRAACDQHRLLQPPPKGSAA